MDRLSQLRGEAGGSGDSTLDTSSAPSEAYMSANENSKYFSLSDSTFDITTIKDVSLASTSSNPHGAASNDDELVSNLSPMGKKEMLDYKIGAQIEAANILSGGVDIFDDNDNSFDGDELVIDDNVEAEEDRVEVEREEAPAEILEPEVLEPEILEPEVLEPEVLAPENLEAEPPLIEEPEANIPAREMEVVLQIDGNNVNAIDIGNGLYLYRKDGQRELAAIQIINDDPQHSFKFLKVRDNAEGNLEVYEEIEIEVPKTVPAKEGKSTDKNTPHVPIVDINKVTCEPSSSSKVDENKNKPTQDEAVASTSSQSDQREALPDSKSEVNFNGKMKFSESRKSPVVGSFTPMTYHSTPNKEGKPLTKTMVDLQLDPNRHSDNVKKTIEVHTENVKQKPTEIHPKEKELVDIVKCPDPNVSKNDVVETTNDHSKKSLVDQEDKTCSPKNKQHPNMIVKSSKRTLDISNPETINDNTVAGKQHNKDQVDLKSNESSQIPDKIEVKDKKEKCDTVDKSDSDVDLLKSNTVVIPQPVTTDLEKATSSTSIDNLMKTIETTKKVVEPVNEKSETDTMKINLQTHGVRNIPPDNNKCTTTPKPESELESSINTNTDREDTIADISSTSNLETHLSKVAKESNVVESTSSTKPLSDAKNTKENLNNAVKVQSNTIDTSNDKSREKVSSTKSSKLDLKDQVHNTCKTSDETTNSHEKRFVEKSDSQHFHSVESSKVELVPEANIPEKFSVESTIKAKLPEPLAEKPVIKDVSISIEDTGPIKTTTSLIPDDIKPSEKNVAHSSINEIKNVSQNNQSSTTATKVELSKDKPISESAPQADVKNSDKILLTNSVATVKQPEEKLDKPVLSHDTTTCLQKVTAAPNKVPMKHVTTDLSAPIKSAGSNKEPSKKLQEKTTLPVSKPAMNASEKNPSSSKSSIAKPLEKTGFPSALPVPKPAALTLMKPAAKQPEKIAVAAISEVKTQASSQDSVNTINRTLKRDHIPVVANIGNKPKHISVATVPGIEAVQKVNEHVTVSNQVTVTTTQQLKITTIDKNVAQNKSQDIKGSFSRPNHEMKPVNNNHSAPVPFGQWTAVDNKKFLDKFKEVKVPASSNSKQIKNFSDLNRRDVLKKIDSQRAQTIINNATAKALEKQNVKNETVFSNKVVPPKLETIVTVKNETVDKKPQPILNKVILKQENPQKEAVTSTVTSAAAAKVEPVPSDLSTATMASLIDRTIEDMINKVVAVPGTNGDESKPTVKITKSELETTAPVPEPKDSKPVVDDPGSLDDIEMKMNELHGIPFVERPPHELPKLPKGEIRTYGKTDKEKPKKSSKIPQISSTSEASVVKDNVIDIDSDDEVIEHEPVTGDIELNKKSVLNKIPEQEKKPLSEEISSSVVVDKDNTKIESIITETDFDKFARRNSITYENCLTVNFDKKEPHSLKQTVQDKNVAFNLNPKHETIQIDIKSKLPQKQTLRPSINLNKPQKSGTISKDCKNYQSKIHSAYQALTAKHQTTRPITIIEDKPVKVVFMETSTAFVPSLLNVQGQELSPAKKPAPEHSPVTTNTADSLGSEISKVVEENIQEKTKPKHQRKQVLTPVEAPELELIQPNDIGIEVSPKKKRKLDDHRADKQNRNLVHKKSYLLGRNAADDQTDTPILDPLPKDIVNRNEEVLDRKDTASAIDSLVKAAELLDNQTESKLSDVAPNADDQPITPVKRGRGRPRKYPLPEGAADNKTPSPQKKPRLIDAKPIKRGSVSDESGDDSSDEGLEGIIRENWTMGKINENIVCPICNKLFRSENVVFKHVKHCTGVSPNRSDSDKRSPRRSRLSQESEDTDDEISISEIQKETRKKRKSKDSFNVENEPEPNKPEVDKEEVIVIEDTPIKEKPEKQDKKSEKQDKKTEKHDKKKDDDTAKEVKAKARNQSDNVCEFCGKTFRQLSYLVNHKLQHKKEQAKKIENGAHAANKLQVFGCETCHKQFRKLHHLVQHRIIHNPDGTPRRTLRKSSSENDNKALNEVARQQNDDQSAAFRCEPCDKSFRKLHHLVEHRETHDGINRQKPAVHAPAPVEKPTPPPQCEICKKTFRKLHHLIEHKEQHVDTSSEKSDDKSVKSSLSTKDIIHECSLCYMVFPNEHSLNKHSVICLKKKRQSKQPKDVLEDAPVKEDESKNTEEQKREEDIVEVPVTIPVLIVNDDEMEVKEKTDISDDVIAAPAKEIVKVIPELNEAEARKISDEKSSLKQTEVVPEMQGTPTKRDLPKSVEDKPKETPTTLEKIRKTSIRETPVTLENVRKTSIRETPVSLENVRKISIKETPTTLEKIRKTSIRETPVTLENVRKTSIKETPVTPEKIKKTSDVKSQEKLKKKTPMEDKVAPAVTKRKRTIDAPPAAAEEVKPPVESSDDDEVRYMFNPNYKVDDNPETTFQKVRTTKRNSLKIERLNSNDLQKRRQSLQHSAKMSRLKPKAIEVKPKAPETHRKSAESKTKADAKLAPPPMLKIAELAEAEAVLSTDSDDSDVKYSFPVSAGETSKPSERRSSKETEIKPQRKSSETKRKVLVGIAKRKSLGKIPTAKHKAIPLLKPVKRRLAAVEHRCDCGQLFSSAALLSRHTSLAHTPPRIRRRRSPPPPPAQPTSHCHQPTRRSQTDEVKPTRKSSTKLDAVEAKATRKSSTKSDAIEVKPTRKSSTKPDTTEVKPTVPARKSSARTEAAGDARKPAKRKSDAAPPQPANTRRSAAPAPHKIRKITQKSKK